MLQWHPKICVTKQLSVNHSIQYNKGIVEIISIAYVYKSVEFCYDHRMFTNI